MIRPIATTDTPRAHLSEDALTRLVCEELSPARRLFAKRHLRRCGRCRARFELLRRAAVEVAEHRHRAEKRLGPLSSSRRVQFIQQLDILLEAVPEATWWNRLRVEWRFQTFEDFVPSLKGALLGICAALFVFSVWHLQIPAVSAAEFLKRAAASDRSPLNVGGSGVVHRRFRVKTAKRTIEHDAYRDLSGRLQPRNDNVHAEDADLAIRLALAGVNWDDPLSAISFKSWHDRQPNPDDEVHSSREGFLTIRTRLASTEIAQESLTVREDGFHPIERTIEYREFGTVEISEVSLDFLSWDRTNQLFFMPELGTRPFAPRVPVRAQLPSISEMNEAELEARLMLNQKSADTGEQIEVTRDGKGVQVRGLVDGEERKKELTESLQAIPFLSVTIRSFGDLESTPSSAAEVTVTQQQSAVAQVSPLERYFVQHGRSRDDLSRISAGLFNSSLAINRSSRSIEQITLRFAAEEGLSPAAIQARDELLSRTIERLLNDLKEQQQFLDDTDLVSQSAAAGPTNPDGDSVDLAHLAALNTAVTRELISGAEQSRRSEKVMAADLAETISQLRTAALSIIPGHSSK
jgi:antitoxin (DNA-binding transcriptional repressor) of toxin-antitoxin stability system